MGPQTAGLGPFVLEARGWRRAVVGAFLRVVFVALFPALSVLLLRMLGVALSLAVLLNSPCRGCCVSGLSGHSDLLSPPSPLVPVPDPVGDLFGRDGQPVRLGVLPSGVGPPPEEGRCPAWAGSIRVLDQALRRRAAVDLRRSRDPVATRALTLLYPSIPAQKHRPPGVAIPPQPGLHGDSGILLAVGRAHDWGEPLKVPDHRYRKGDLAPRYRVGKGRRAQGDQGGCNQSLHESGTVDSLGSMGILRCLPGRETVGSEDRASIWGLG